MTWLNRNIPLDRVFTEDTSRSIVWELNFLVHPKMQLLMFDDISMFVKNVSGSRAIRLIALMALTLPGFGGRLLLCQAISAPPTQAQTTVRVAMRDSRLPEVQQRLDVDRDPVPSPDSESIPNVSETSPLAPGAPDEIQKSQDGSYTMHKDVDEVLLTCAVVDEKGQPIQDLSRGDFRVWEDGVKQATTSFLHQDQPVSLGILVDNSGSMRDKRVAVNAAALDLLKASNSQDAAFIVNFSDRAILDQAFTSDIAALNRGLSHFDSRGTTALYDAVAASADELVNHAKLPKQVLLVITDGADNASRLDLEQAIRRVQNLGGPVVYTIGLLFGIDKEESDRARDALEKLSQETGGIAYFPHSLEDVDTIATEVARDIRGQYTIGYHSSNPVSLGGYRVVHVEANAPKHGRMIVRTRRGYFAQKPAAASHQTQAASNAKQ